MDYRIEEFPSPYNQIAEGFGVDVAVGMAKMFSGEQVYFPKAETLERPIRDRKIIKEFNGYNHQYLAKKYKLTVRAIQEIVKPHTERKKNEPMHGQYSLFLGE